MKKKIEFGTLKPGDCFRLSENGPIYMKDPYNGGQQIFGKRSGTISKWLNDDKKVYPVKVKISEVK